MNALDLAPRGFALLAIQIRDCCAGQPPLRAVHNRRHHLQIAEQFGAGPGWSFLLRLPLGFEKQRGISEVFFQNAPRLRPRER